MIIGVALAVVVIVVAARESALRTSAEPVDVGWLAVVGFVVALFVSHHLLISTALGLALLLAGGAVAQWQQLSALPHLALLVPGAVVLADARALRPLLPRWAIVLVIIATIVGGWAGAALDRNSELRGLAPVVYAVTAVGLYATVPDTDFALVLGGVLVPYALVSIAGPAVRTGAAGAAGLAGAVCVVAAIGGYGRPSAIIGGVGCLALLYLAPLLVTRASRAVLVVVQVVLVWFAARVAGRQAFPRRAIIVLLLAELVVAAGFALARRPRSLVGR